MKTTFDIPPILKKDLKVDRKSPAYRRATYAGFKIGEVRVYEGISGTVALQLPFECVCGTKEFFLRTFTAEDVISFESLLMYDRYFTENGWDGALEIEHRGAFSAEHLRGEGYSEEAIREIRYIYDLEEEVITLRRENEIVKARLSQYEYRTP
jgi:hypothetical protein